MQAETKAPPRGPFGNFQRQPATRERLAAALQATKEARAKIEAQAAQREKRRKFIEKATKGTKPGTTAYFQAIAAADRAAGEAQAKRKNKKAIA